MLVSIYLAVYRNFLVCRHFMVSIHQVVCATHECHRVCNKVVLLKSIYNNKKAILLYILNYSILLKTYLLKQVLIYKKSTDRNILIFDYLL